MRGVSRLLTRLLTILRLIAMNSELLLSMKSEYYLMLTWEMALLILGYLAEETGFEPTERVNVRRLCKYRIYCCQCRW